MQVFIDFECTGLDKMHCHIIQIAGTFCRDKQKIGEFCTLVHTDKQIQQKASEITGIKNEHLKGKPKINVALNQFFTKLKKLRKKDEKVSLWAYNGMNYDFPILFSEMHRWDMNLHRTFSECGIVEFIDPLLWGKKNLDTAKLIRNKKGNASFKMGNIYLSLLKKELKGAHDAQVDTDGLFEICCHEDFSRCFTDEIKEDERCKKITYKFVNEFMVKRKEVDAVTRKNLRNKIRSLFEILPSSNEPNNNNKKKRRL